MGTSLVVVVLVALGPWKSSFEFIWISSFSALAKMLMPSLTSIQTFLKCLLFFDSEASVVLNFVWMVFIRECIRRYVAVNGDFMTFESVVSRKSALPVIARSDVNLAAVQALARVHGAALGVRASLLPRLASPAVRKLASCQIEFDSLISDRDASSFNYFCRHI